ncbi:MAG: hypothetical protein AAF433_00800 [Bacteroidota bacterium]
MFRVALFLLLLGQIMACRPSLDRLSEDRLHFGTSGGFAGSSRTYIISASNGKILLHESLTEELSRVGRLNKEGVAEVFRRLESLPDKAGAAANHNAFFQQFTDNQLVREIKWAAPSSAPNTATQQLFEDLMAMMRQLNEM